MIGSLSLQYGRGRIEGKAERKKQGGKNGLKKAPNGTVPSLPEADEEVDAKGKHAIIKSSTVISEDDLVLVPNGIHMNGEPKSPSLPRNRSYNTLKHEFKLGDCLDYINAGIEAVIEDEVTQRFIAEDIKVFSGLSLK